MQYETVQKYIELGKQTGMLELTGSFDTSNLTIDTQNFTNAPEDSQIMKEEIFGPVVVTNTSKTEEVIAKANDSEFGLYASLWSKDLERTLRVSKKLESGMVCVNCASPTECWDLPFGR